MRHKVLTAGRHAAGSYTESWDGTDEFGNALPSGTYFLRLTAGGRTLSKQVAILR
jgi:hypothetical protein